MNSIIFIFIVFTYFVIEICKGQKVSDDLYQCRQICYTNFVQDWRNCTEHQECKDCWNSCDEKLALFSLSVTSASRQGPLVLTDIEWDKTISDASKQCLVTWEISGGGLMGNLLTDSFTVELSLWADKVYHIQVTCKNKDADTVRKSYKLIVDTRKIGGMSSTSSSSSSPIKSPVSSTEISINTNNDVLPTETLSKYTKDQLRFLKTKKIKDKVHSIKMTSSERTTTTHSSHVIRTKLDNSNKNLPDLYSRYILYAMIASLGLFLSTVFIYILLRPTGDDKPVERENLLNSEMFQDTKILHV